MWIILKGKTNPFLQFGVHNREVIKPLAKIGVKLELAKLIVVWVLQGFKALTEETDTGTDFLDKEDFN